MAEYEDYKEGLEYSEDVKNAVRYGYQYRKEAEEYKDSNIKYCLGEPSEILYWIATMIISGLGWDLLKCAVKKAAKWISKQRIKTDEETNKILTDEKHLRLFYVYVKEFNEHNMSVDDKTLKYVKEEIIADYAGETIEELISNENRIPEIEEYTKIIRNAFTYADNMLYGESRGGDSVGRDRKLGNC